MNIVWLYDQPMVANVGGTERVTVLVSEGLEKKGVHTVSYLIFHREDNSIRENNETIITNLYQYLIENDVSVVFNQIGFADWLLRLFLNKGGEKWKNEGGKLITVMHFSPVFPSNTIKNLLRDWKQRSFHKKVKRLVRILLLANENRRMENFHRHAYQYLYEQSDKYVMLSKTHYEDFRVKSGVEDQSKLYAIANPLTYELNYSVELLPTKKKQLLIVSRMDEAQKRISLSLKSWRFLSKKYPDWTLEIVGVGGDLDEYKDYVQHENLERITFHGHQEPQSFYKDASILLFTSPKEGWGLTLTEAMEYGCVPVVVDSCDVFHEILDNGKCGVLVSKPTVEAFSKAICTLIDSGRLRNLMAKAGLVHVENFTLDSVVAKYKKMIDELVL